MRRSRRAPCLGKRGRGHRQCPWCLSNLLHARRRQAAAFDIDESIDGEPEHCGCGRSDCPVFDNYELEQLVKNAKEQASLRGEM